MFLISTVQSCLYYPGTESGSHPSSWHETEKEGEWCNDFPQYIIPRICAYYQLHPERFKPTGQGEEIEIEGLAAFVKQDDYFKVGHRAHVWSGKLLDPWGDPVHFVEDLNMDGTIEVAGVRSQVFRYGVYHDVLFTNEEHHFGVLKQSPFKPFYGTPSARIYAETFYDARSRK